MVIEFDPKDITRQEGVYYNYTDLHTPFGALMWTYNELNGEYYIYLGKRLSLITRSKRAIDSFIDYYRGIQGMEIDLKRENSNA